jgi:hypothetical protein
MTVRYLLDENVKYALAIALRARDPELVVWVVGDPGAPPPGTPDPVILRWCEGHDFVLLTNNRRTMPPHLADHLREGRHVPGIFVLNPGLSVGETVENLIDAARFSLEGEYRDQIRHLPL